MGEKTGRGRIKNGFSEIAAFCARFARMFSPAYAAHTVGSKETGVISPIPFQIRIPRSVRATLKPFFLGLMVVVVAIDLGLLFVPRSTGFQSPPHVSKTGNALIDTLTLWDSQWYMDIAEHGYHYSAAWQSSVAFFPGYPLCVALIRRLTGAPVWLVSLVLTSVFLFASMVLLYDYVRRRFGESRPMLAGFAIMTVALFPTAFFFRMAYSESLFFFLNIIVFYGFQRDWPLWLVSTLVGMATATRATGVALLLPLMFYASRDGVSFWRNFTRITLSAIVGLSGLLAYIAYQKLAFDSPGAFIQTQQYWVWHRSHDWVEKAMALVWFKPAWWLYLPGSPGYTGHIERAIPVIFQLEFANPVFFIAAFILSMVGEWKGWLTRDEVLLTLGLLFVSYVGKGFEMCMTSQGRFVAAIFPIYLVIANILDRIPRIWAIASLAISGFFLAAYSAMLAAGYFTI